MAYKDYEDLDVTKETASEEEVERIKKEYEVEQEYPYKVRKRGIRICFGIAMILTIITMLLFHEILVVDLVIIVTFPVAYFVTFSIITLEIYTMILNKRTNRKGNIYLLIGSIDILIFTTTCIIGLMGSISNIVKAILLIVTAITFILFVLWILIGKILGMESK